MLVYHVLIDPKQLVRNSHYERGWCHLYITKEMLFRRTRLDIALHFKLDVNCVRCVGVRSIPFI